MTTKTKLTKSAISKVVLGSNESKIETLARYTLGKKAVKVTFMAK